MDTKLLTYAELGEALGITADSAKRLARRRGWMKQPGNDGRARVSVPVERLVPRDDPADDPEDVREDDPRDAPEDSPGVVVVLERHVERLERDLDGTKGELDAAKRALEVALRERDEERTQGAILRIEAAVAPALRQTVEALKGALDGERNRAADLRAERDRLLRELEQQMTRRSWWPFRRAG